MNQKPPKKNLQVSEVINLQVGGDVLAHSENQAPLYETHNAENPNNSKIKKNKTTKTPLPSIGTTTQGPLKQIQTRHTLAHMRL
jgi:hypothetical protein